MRACLLTVLVVSAAGSANAADEPISIAALDLNTNDQIDETIARALSGAVAAELERLGPFDAISSQDIRRVLELQILKDSVGGCSDGDCLAELGGALGVEYVISGDLFLADGAYLLQMVLIDVQRTRTKKRVNREYRGGLEGLLQEIATATHLLVGELLAEASGYLTVAVSEEGATIKVDGLAVGVSPMPATLVAGGLHSISVEKEGFILFNRDLEIESKGDTSVEVTLIPSHDFVQRYQHRASRIRILAWSALGTGAVALAVGGVLYGVACDQAAMLQTDIAAYNSQSSRRGTDREALREREADIGLLDSFVLASAITGVVAGVTGGLLFWLGGDPNRYDDIATTTTVPAAVPTEISLWPLEGGGMIVLTTGGW